jgi:hypothetical protein
MAACEFGGNKPQMNADERRWSPVMGLLDAFSYAQFPATDFGATHRKGRKERKVQPQSVFYHVYSSLKNLASAATVSAFIRVHLRFFKKNVIIQTGFIGYVFNPVILSNLNC